MVERFKGSDGRVLGGVVKRGSGRREGREGKGREGKGRLWRRTYLEGRGRYEE
jgi:hypothetical protein